MELGDSLRDIGDPELRTVLESLARKPGRKTGRGRMKSVCSCRGDRRAPHWLSIGRRARTWLTTVAATPDGHRLGNPDAKVKLVAYESYTCPHCSQFREGSRRRDAARLYPAGQDVARSAPLCPRSGRSDRGDADRMRRRRRNSSTRTARSTSITTSGSRTMVKATSGQRARWWREGRRGPRGAISRPISGSTT